MKHSHRTLSWLLAMVLLLCILPIAASAEGEPVSITIATNQYNVGHPASLEDNFVYQTILEKTGVAVDLAYLDDYETALNARLIGNEAPDAWICTPDAMQTYAEQGLLLPLSEYRDTMIKTILDAYGDDIDIPSLYYDGELYGIPAAKALVDQYMVILVRKDWNEKYGLAVPTTVDELYDYCEWLANNDPDGNGSKDTIGLTVWGTNGLTVITAPYDVILQNAIIIRDGKVTNSVLQESMVDALAMVKKFYENDLLDPDLYSIENNGAVKSNVLACKVGVACLPWSHVFKAQFVSQYQSVVPEAEYTWIDSLSDGNGAQAFGSVQHDKFAGEHYVINGDIEEEKLEALFKVLEYLCTDEGKMLIYCGVEGVHWNYDEAGNVIATNRASEANYTAEWQVMGRKDDEYLVAKFPEASDVIPFAFDMNRYEIFNANITVPTDFNLSDMEDYISMQLIDFYKGNRDLAEYDQFIQELYDNYDFGTYMELCTEQLIAQGLATE